jgi:hypothetical protein
MWILVLAMYGAPPDAVDWDGPWTYMETKVLERQFSSEAECRNTAIKLIGDIHQGLLAPIRYRCVELPAGLPKGAPR